MIKYFFIDSADFRQIAQLIALYRDAGWWGDGPDNPEHITDIIRGSYCFVAAVVDGETVGMGRVISDGVSDSYIQDVTVRADWRGKGIAAEIIRMIIKRLLRDGLSWIALIAERGTEDLYRGQGFREMENSTPLKLEVLDAL